MAAEFVRLVDERVSLAAGWERLVRASDLKISQRALEKLSELDYKASPGRERARAAVRVGSDAGGQTAAGLEIG